MRNSNNHSQRNPSTSSVEPGTTPSSLQRFAAAFDPLFDTLLEPGSGVPRRLADAVRYAALAPGKRLRPYLVVRCCELVGGAREHAFQVAAAFECIHAFSLIHDDLPCMDNDDFRRGRPTLHRHFDEATAILAGDALSVLAFELIAGAQLPSETRLSIVAEMARCAGWTGLIGGQMADISGENEPRSLPTTQIIHLRKTAALIEGACRSGALAGGANPEKVDRLGVFGRELGLAFQITDDLLDVSSTDAVAGKSVGKDANAGKQTYPACVGKEESRLAAVAAIQAAVSQLAEFGPAADDLRQLAESLIDRTY